MRIRTRYTLLQLIIVFGFLVSMVFVLLRFTQAYTLKQLELQGVESLINLKVMEKRTTLLTGRNEPLDLLWTEWVETYEEFNSKYTAMLSNPDHNILGDQSVNSRNARQAAWTDIQLLEIRVLQQEVKKMELLDRVEEYIEQSRSEGVAVTRNTNLNSVREIILQNEGEDSALAADIQLIDDRFARLKESMVASISIPTTRFVEDLGERVARFSNTLYLTTLFIALSFRLPGR